MAIPAVPEGATLELDGMICTHHQIPDMGSVMPRTSLVWEVPEPTFNGYRGVKAHGYGRESITYQALSALYWSRQTIETLAADCDEESDRLDHLLDLLKARDYFGLYHRWGGDNNECRDGLDAAIKKARDA